MLMAKAIKMFLFSLLLCHTAEAISQDPPVIADDQLYINDILISGNKVTHESVILRELIFSAGDTIYKMQLIPALQSSGEVLAVPIALAMVKAAALLLLLLTGGQKVMRWWLTLVARRKSDELFMLNLLLITLGLAWLTEHAGLSLALGAFVAGMLVAETEYKHQVETDIRPFHDVLLGLFFITIGMKLDWRPVIDQWFLVLVLTTLPLFAKFALVAGLAHVFRAAPGVALRTGLYLAQAGEFGFVLLSLGSDYQLIDARWLSPVLAAMVLSMLAAPFIIMYSNRIVARVSATDWMMQSVQLTSIAKKCDPQVIAQQGSFVLHPRES